jgi:hypothetical protein
VAEDLEDEARLSELAARAMRDIDGAIRLVSLGSARSVQLSGLDPDDETIHAGAAHAQADGVAFRIERRGSRSVTVIVGPRTAPGATTPDPRHS